MGGWQTTIRALAGSACAVLMMTAVVTRGSAQQSAPEASSRWPQAVVIVFERRIPFENSQRGAVGAQLRELRQRVVRYLSEEAGLRRDDHLFIFGDGMTQENFDCLVKGQACGRGLEPLTWGSRTAARTFLTRMLQLPGGPCQGPGTDVIVRDGAQFLHLIYDGTARAVDCAIRREVTAPMTLSPTFEEGRECPTEGRMSNIDETRAISRVEMSMGVQFSLALAALRDRPVERLQWVWALLEHKNFASPSVRHGIRSDFGRKSPPIEDFFDHSYREYQVTPMRESTETSGPYIVPHEIRWNRTERLREQYNANRELIALHVGERERQRLGNTLSISRGLFEGWGPRVDRMRFDAVLDPKAGGRLVAADVRASHHGSIASAPDPVMADGRKVTLALPEIDRAYQDVLRTWWWPKQLSLQSTFWFLIAGPEGPPDFGFVPLPGVVYATPDIQVAWQLPSTQEAIIIVVTSTISLLVVIQLLRAHRFEVKLKPDPITWELPGTASVRHLEIVGYTDYRHRRIRRTQAAVSIEWALLVQVGFPVGVDEKFLQIRPGGSRLTDTPLAAETTHGPYLTQWLPGPRSAPTTIQTLDLQLDLARFRSLPLAKPIECGGELRMTVHVAARVWPRLKEFHETIRVPVVIHIEEIRATPRFRFEIDALFRRLGFDAVTQSDFGSVIVTNKAAQGDTGVPRAIDLTATVCLEAQDWRGASVCFEDGATTRRESLAGNGSLNWRVFLKPEATPPASAVRVSCVVHLEWHEQGSQDTHVRTLRRKFTWIPFETRLAGLDLGTSGTRLYIQNGDRAFEDERVRFPMRDVNVGDPTPPVNEFPSVVLIDDANRKVARAGGWATGIHAETRKLRFVQSPKAALLTALGKAAVNAAKKDLDLYVAALGRSWRNIKDEWQLDKIKLVVTVPGSYDQPLTAWYTHLIQEHFPGVVFVVHVREAEAAAHFHIVRQYLTFERDRSVLPEDRAHRTLVVDMGAGTVDVAVIGTSAPGGEIAGLQTLAHDSRLWAGDRYDEQLLVHLFGESDASERLTHEPWLRDEIRRFKERDLESFLQSGHMPPSEYLRTPRAMDRREFQELMQPFFVHALTEPLSAIAERLARDYPSQKNPYIDEVLLAGRGVFCLGVRDWIEEEIGRLFAPPPQRTSIPIRSFGPADGRDTPWVIVRGALTFGRAGDVSIGSTDQTATQDTTLIAETGGRLALRDVKRTGERLEEDERLSFPFPKEVRRAWLVRGAPMLTETMLVEGSRRLVSGDSPGDGMHVIATWQPTSGVTRIDVVSNDDGHARFVSQ